MVAVAPHCTPLPAIAAAIKPGMGAVQTFTREQAKALVAFVAARVTKPIPNYDTIAVLFATDNRAVVFLGNGGTVCTVMVLAADDARAIIKGALGAGL